MIYILFCYGEICNHHRNSLNKGPCHRTEKHGETPWTEHVKNYTLSLCKYYNKLLLYLFKPIVHIISFISFHGILSLDYPYIIATSGYIIFINVLFYQATGIIVSVCQWSRRPGFNPRLSHR